MHDISCWSEVAIQGAHTPPKSARNVCWTSVSSLSFHSHWTSRSHVTFLSPLSCQSLFPHLSLLTLSQYTHLTLLSPRQPSGSSSVICSGGWSQAQWKYSSIIVVGGVRPSASSGVICSGGWSQAQWKYSSIIVVGGVRPSGSSSVMVTGLVKVVVLHWWVVSSLVPRLPTFFCRLRDRKPSFA